MLPPLNRFAILYMAKSGMSTGSSISQQILVNARTLWIPPGDRIKIPP